MIASLMAMPSLLFFHILENTMLQEGETEMCMGNNAVIVPSSALL